MAKARRRQLRDLRYGLATHYHPDHAGMAQELKRAGVPLLVVDVQVGALTQLKHVTKPQSFMDITLHDTGAVFTGDLTLPGMSTDQQAAEVDSSWQQLRVRGARQVYPGHGPAVGHGARPLKRA